jgi:hypothetical protein
VKKAISVTLTGDNLLWAKAQAAARTGGNMSELIDRLIHDARTAGLTDRSAVRSVVGSIDLPDDEGLAEADSYVRAMFDRSLGRPMLVRETPRKSPRRG